MTSPPRAIWQALVPAWFVLVGMVALWLPPPTVAMGALLLVVTAVFVPVAIVTVDGWMIRRR